MNRVLIPSLGLLILSDISNSMTPVYSAQASADFNNNQNGQPSNGNQNGRNQQNGTFKNGNYQSNTGYVNSNNQNGYSNNNGVNNGQMGNTQPTTFTNRSNGNASVNNYGQNSSNQNNNNGYNSNSDRNGSNTNNQNANNNFNVQSNNAQPNTFTENYTLKGRPFNAYVYKKDADGRLYKMRLNSQDLQKAIIIFFGDWCPHCSRFLGNFSRNMPSLTQAGVKIIFIGVPSIDRLQNWREPTDADFNEHFQKLSSFGIQLGNNSELVLLGDKASLNNNVVDSLPTMMAVSNGRECFRGGADNSIEKVEFNNQDAIGQFLQVFNSFGSQNVANSNNYNNSNVQQPYSNNIYKPSKTRNTSKTTYHGKINADRTNMFTEMLNNNCNWSCAVKKWAPPSVVYSAPSLCPPCPVCPVCPQCSTPVNQSSIVQNPVQEIDGNYSKPKDIDTCTTCGCMLKRAIKKRCSFDQPPKKCRTRKCCKKQY